MSKYSKRDSPNDISIGEGLWVKFRDIDEGKEDAFQIDRFMDELSYFWKSIETECVAACCGIDAFCLWPEQIIKNTKHLNYENVVLELKLLRQNVIDAESKIVVSNSLNNYFNKMTFIEMLDHIVDVLENSEPEASS